MPRTTKPPAYRLYKRTGQAVVTLNGRDHYLGCHDTPESHQCYDALIAEWLSGGRAFPARTDLTVSELVARYWRFAENYYRKNGEPTVELQKLRANLRPLVHLYGATPASQFGPLALKALRQKLIDDGYSRVDGKSGREVKFAYTRRHINQSIGRLKRVFKWAVENELVTPSVYHGLQAVAGLKWGRCEARETEPIRPVPATYVDAIKPHVSRQVWSMVELQQLTGMRSGEVVIMRARDLDTAGPIWLYRPESHKTQHHGHERIVELGPRSQTVLKSFLKPDLDAYLFSPRDAVAEQKIEKRRKRKSTVQPSQRDRSRPKPRRTAGDRYTPDSYRGAIQRACDVADAKARADLIKAGAKPGEDRIIPRWHPHQLRHNYATMIRRQYGIETARILLGHRSVAVTEVYAEVDRAKTREIVARIG